jgi:hypothetical protein
MTSAGHYRALAAQCDAKAKQETDWKVRAEWEHMARSYHRLAEQAERNAQTDVIYETPPPRPAAIPSAQQQQQQQPQQPQTQGESQIEPEPETDP